MPKVVDPHAQRRQIRRAARDVFSRRGLAGTGLAQVADAAGMGRSSLYHYYPDKESLVRDLIRDLLAAEESLFERASFVRSSGASAIAWRIWSRRGSGRARSTGAWIHIWRRRW